MAQNSVASPPMSPLSPHTPGPSPSTSTATPLSPNQLKLQALKQKKVELEKKLAEKNSQLQEICRKEAHLVGIYPVAGDGTLPTSSTLPRKVGTSFKLSEILLNSKEDDVNNLLLQKQLQQQICKASQKLMSDTSQPKSVRRAHKANYEAAHQKLLTINHTLALIKRRQYQQHAEESPALRRNSVGSANTRPKTASINSDSSGNINGSEGALNEPLATYQHLHHSPTKSVASFPGAGIHGTRKHSNTMQFYPTFQGHVVPDPHDYYYNNHHIKHRSAILLQQQQQQQNLHLYYPPEEPPIYLQPPDLFCDQFVEPPRPSTSYHSVVAQPELDGAFGVPTVAGLGGYWALNENNERVWCSMERFSSLDRTKQQSRATRVHQNVTPTKSTSLGNFDFLTKHDGDTISLSSLSSEKKQQLREKVWCETSLDSVVTKAKAHMRPVPPIPVEERSKENIYQNHSEVVASVLERSHSQAPYDHHRPPPLPPMSSTMARSAGGIHRTNSSISAGGVTSPGVATLTKAADIRIESPKNVTVVQQAKFMPYKEVTKPFEMSDFYKYSTKFRQKVMLGEVNVATTPEPPASNSSEAQAIQKGVYQPPNPSICHPISYQ